MDGWMDVRDKQTDVRRASSLNAPGPKGEGITVTSDKWSHCCAHCPFDKQQQDALLLLLLLLRPVVSRRTTANDGLYLLGIFLACVMSVNQLLIFYLPEQKPDTLVNVSTNMTGYQKSCRAHQAGQPL